MMDAERGIIFDIRRFSVHDGPGIRTTVFFKGCPLACWWCHNPESQAAGPQMMLRESRCILCGDCLVVCLPGATSQDGDRIVTDDRHCSLCGACVTACPTGAREIAGREMGVEEVMAEVERDLPFYEQTGGGVTFSGGEPLLQASFLHALLTACKEKGIHTTVDTCGHTSWDALDRVRELTDLFLFDVKLMDEEKHRKYTGVTNRVILKNLRALARSGANIQIRVPIIPGITDAPENLAAIGELASSLPGVGGVDVLPYHQTAAAKYERLKIPNHLAGLNPPSAEYMEDVAATLHGYGLQINVGG
jgi:pyruvate formate lyase activating enzyme